MTLVGSLSHAAENSTDAAVRHQLRVCGVVQGVGFRPFVYRLANELGLAGHVGNDAEGVFVEVEGAAADVARFEGRLEGDAPPLARIFEVRCSPLDPVGERGFRIVESRTTGAATTFVAPDVAVCDDCLAEMRDPADRRYRYPFINCTNCGPRFTITVRLPYDRPNTTMAGFTLCPSCAREYHDPSDRRFHAQPVACPTCGPRLWFECSSGAAEGTDAALAEAQRALARGEIVALKGIGGYHLACDAVASGAVDTLRRRKHRSEKPFAVMVRDVEAAQQIAHVDAVEAALLRGVERPIVLLARRAGGLSPSVAPACPCLGVVLPYTPVHHLLFEPVPGSDAPVPRVLVMTSGNLSDEPICHEDQDARRRLGHIADAWLLHDRPIHVPCDDSVVRVEDGHPLPIRRSRGFAPLPVHLPFDVGALVAVGGELKNTFCVASGTEAWMSQHIGDMGSVETLEAFEHATGQLCELYRVDPALAAADAHPGYHTRRWAESHHDNPVLVHHHHAHVAAVMAEHQVPREERVLGFAFDGTGFGRDGAIWGGEVLVVGYGAFERVAHLRYVPLPGGDATVRKPYRAALAHLWAAGVAWTPDLPPVGAAPASELAVLERQLSSGAHCVPTSSMGRLFDAVSALLGVRQRASYEAQAAIELEAIAGAHLGDAGRYCFALRGEDIDAAPVLVGMVDDLRAGRPPGAIAAGFHLAVARLVAQVAQQLRRHTGIDRVALSGGVFQNVVLLGLTRAELVAAGCGC